MTVRPLNALLYVDAQPEADDLRRALRITALSPGWKDSMRALLEAGASGALAGGNAGLVPPAPPPAWSGFRALRVVAKRPETVDVVSLELEPDDATPLARAVPGQFVTVRLHSTGSGTSLLRSYSLSGPPEGERYRISVKVEPRGAAGHVVRDEIEVGDLIDVAAPRGRFVLDDRRTSSQPIALGQRGRRSDAGARDAARARRGADARRRLVGSRRAQPRRARLRRRGRATPQLAAERTPARLLQRAGP